VLSPQPRFSLARQTTGFTLVELLVVIAIILVLLGIVLGVLAKVQKSARQARCLQNLRQIGVAINGFAIQNGGRFPDPASEDLGWEDVVSRFTDIHPLLACPSDEEVFPTIKSSYDWRDTGNPATTLADEMIGSVPGNTVLAFEAMPGWHARNTMNVVLVDGSASTMSAHDALLNLTQPLRTTASSSPSGKGVP
jgi:prepilin-type N-terminal cleavage/methylation domain-containing protein